MGLEEPDHSGAVLLCPGRIDADAIELVNRYDFERVSQPVESLINGDVRIGDAEDRSGYGSALQSAQARRGAAGDHHHGEVAWIVQTPILEVIEQNRRRPAAQTRHAEFRALEIIDLFVGLAADKDVRG